jgi:hypothetical protein
MPYEYTKELHEQWRKDSGDWKNSFHPDAIVTLLDEIEKLRFALCRIADANEHHDHSLDYEQVISVAKEAIK